MGAFDTLSDDDPRLTNKRREEMNHNPYRRTKPEPFSGDYTQLAIHAKGLEAENARLKAELEAVRHLTGEVIAMRERSIEALELELDRLKPKPVVTKLVSGVSVLDGYLHFGLTHTRGFAGRVEYTFTDGVLTGAEVINKGDSK